MRKLTTAAIVLTSLFIGGSALAEEGGLQVGARLGYGLAMGDVAKDSKMSDGVKSQIPIWLDVGYNVSDSLMVGAYVQYGIAQLADKACPDSADCSASDLRFGVQGHYHLSPGESMDPWFGLGVGYEIASASASGETMGQKFDSTASYSGFEFANLQAGLDFEASEGLGVGPFVSFSIGQFSSANLSVTGQPDQDGDIKDKAMHQWIVFGVRGAFNL